MKKVISILLAVIISIGYSFATSVFAAELPIVPTSSKTTITIEKTDLVQQEFNEKGTHVLKSYNQELTAYINEEENRIGTSFYLADENGNRKYLQLHEVKLESSDSTIFSIDGSKIIPHQLGSAYLQVTYAAQTITVPVDVVEYDVMFKFKKLDEKPVYIWTRGISYKVDENKYSYGYIGGSETKEETIQLFDINWEQGRSYNVLFRVNNYIYSVDFDKSDKGQLIEVPYDQANFTKVTFDVPTTDYVEGVDISLFRNGVKVNKFEGLDIGTTAYFMNGEYGFLYKASSEANYYKAFKESTQLTGGEVTFEFPLENFSRLQLQMDFMTNPINTLSICKTKSECNTTTTNQPLYVKNDVYDAVTTTVNLDDYRYKLSLAPFSLVEDTNITVNSNFTTDIRFGKDVYQGGTAVRFSSNPQAENYLTVQNSAGHSLTSIIKNSDYNFVFGKLILTNGSEIYEVPVKGYDGNPHIELPNVSGTFDVLYTFDDNEPIASKTRPDLSGTWKDWLKTKTVASDHTWTVTLSSAADTKTITTDNVLVVDADGYLVEGTQVKVEGNQILITAPSNGYASGNYTLYIRDAVKNTEAKALSNTKMKFIVN